MAKGQAGGRAPKKRRGKAAAPTLPVVTAESILQARSRPIFDEAVSPWLVTNWTAHDYGIDAIVEVLRDRDDGRTGQFNTGRRFGVQLKAGNAALRGAHVGVRVKVRTVHYWLASHDPIMLVYCQVRSRRLVYRWIDDDLVAELAARNPGWFAHESVTVQVPLDQLVSNSRLIEIDREAGRVIAKRHRVLAPGTYDRLLTEASSAMRDVSQAAREASLGSVVAQLDAAESKVRNATYVVAIAGRMRAGKSTLFNALIRRAISPVARRPTTAVPIFVAAGACDLATVAFLDGTTRTIDASANALAEYVTQESNGDNHRRVRMVFVRLVSDRLERGIAVLDAPGLFDPSEQIRDVTARALASSHAVLFVIDVSAARTGGFAVESHVLDELKRTLAHSERVFLLLNKADELSKTDRDDVLATLSVALGRESLVERLAAQPVFISAKRAWEWVLERPDSESPIAALEAEVWDYLLKTNSTGVVRLETAVRESIAAIEAVAGLTRLRRATSEEARATQARLLCARKDIVGLREDCESAKERTISLAESRLREELAILPRKMGDEMRAADALPSTTVVVQRLRDRVEAIITDTWEGAMRTLGQDAQDISERLQAALDQVRLEHDVPPQHTIVLPSLAAPEVSQLAPEAFGFGVLGSVLAFALGPAYSILVGIGAFIFGAIVGKDRQLARGIAKMQSGIRSEVDKAIPQLVGEVSELVGARYERLTRYVADRWAVFEKDANKQLSRAGAPLTEMEGAALQRVDDALRRALERLTTVAEEMRWTPSPSSCPPHGG